MMKGIKKLSIAVLLLLAIAMPFAAITGVMAASTGSITFTSPSGDHLAIGSTFTVTAHITGASGVWQWAINNIAWNSAVISYTGTVENGYSGSAPSSGTLFLAPAPNAATNGGLISQISDTRFAMTNPTASSGDLCTLTFQVVGYGNADITVGSAVAQAADQSITTLTATGTSYVGLPVPQPYGPTAVISAPVGNSFVLTNTAVALDGSASTGGFVNPNFLPITSYAWTINGAGIVNLNMNGATPGSVTPTMAGDMTVSLTVTAAGANPATSTVSVIVHVYAPATGAAVDVYTQRGGLGPLATSDAFGPQENVMLYANVTYNAVPVVGKEVAFQVVDAHGVTIAIRSAITDANGLATASYRLPWPDTNPEATFGTWTINATTTVSEVVKNDTCTFTFNYLLKTTTTATLTASGSPATSFARMTPSSGQMKVSVTVRNIATTAAYTGKECVTVYDEGNVPVAVVQIDVTVPAGQTITVAQTITLPHYAFVGQAKAYVDVLTNFPSVGGVPYCPETVQPFSITA